MTSIMERAIDRVWKHKLQSGQIDEELFKAETKVLLQGLYSSMGDPVRMGYANTKLDTLQAMRRNVFTFVAFKNHHQVNAMVDLLQDDKGNLRPKADFMREARKISVDYNKKWLTAEYDTVVASGQTAAQWHDFQKNKDLLPFLIYKTQEDSRVRDSHAVLHNVCKPIDDPFWDEFYPPNGWRCRCYVLQVAKHEGKEDPESEPSAEEVKPIFRNNAGKSGIIFDKEHPYFAGMEYSTTSNILIQMRNILAKDESLYDRVYQSRSTSATVDTHITHDLPEKENNLRIAKWLADKGYSGKLLPVSWIHKNPDYQLQDGTVVDFKIIAGKQSIKNGMSSALAKSTSEKKVTHVLFEILSYDRSEIRDRLMGQFKVRQDLQGVWLMYQDELYRIERDRLEESFSQLP